MKKNHHLRLVLAVVENSSAEELVWVQRNTCEIHAVQPSSSPVKEVLCPLDHRGLSSGCLLPLGLLPARHLMCE